MTESQLVIKIKQYLKDKGAYVEKIWGGGFQSAGIPDIIACYKGRFLGIEVKVGNNKPSEIQLVKLKRINDADGVGVVVWSLEEVKELIGLLDEADMKFENKEKEMDNWSK